MKFNKAPLALAITALLLAACSDDGKDGKDGSDGSNGSNGSNGSSSLIRQSTLSAGDYSCTKGGILFESGVDADGNGVLADAEVSESNYVCNPSMADNGKSFNRIASFPVCSQDLGAGAGDCNSDDATSAEIVAASSDGMTLVYTDSPAERVGFVDISNPAALMGLGVVDLAAAYDTAAQAEPTSVAVVGDYALAAVNTSDDYVTTSGKLAVIDIASRTIVQSFDLPGQPDSIAVSKDGMYVAIVIENERDEDLGDGVPPQAPAGSLVVMTLDGDVANWTSTTVDMTGMADKFPGDPEPEYVDINANNEAVVTLQENNYIAIVDLATATVTNHFSAGSVDLMHIDEEDDGIVTLSESQQSVPREPDGVSWINNDYFATADEGDLEGGSRGFTVFNKMGDVVYTSASELEFKTVMLGHYPDGRSDNKGNEPENIEMGVFGGDRFLFVASERSSLVFVYDAAQPNMPIYKQALPAAVAPEGVLAIPSRNLVIAASEEDARDDKMRSALNIYQYQDAPAAYPTLVSTARLDGTPIPWSAISGLSAGAEEGILYAVDDSAFIKSRIFKIDTNYSPARIVNEMRISDSNDILATLPAAALADATVADDDATRLEVFDAADLSAMINDDKTVNVDSEGVAMASDGGFWVATEGSGTMGDAGRPINSLNMVIKTDAMGVIEQVFTLPAAVNDMQLRFGFEGITEYNGMAYVAFQRAWGDETNVRIGVLNPADGSWEFFFYPLDAVESQAGGWVGLSDITSMGNGEFLVVERDNQGGPDAAIKRLYSIDVSAANDGDTLNKTLVRDLVVAGDLSAPGGLIYEKIEGSAIMANGDVFIANDNDGVDDNSGETQLINLGQILAD